MVRLLLVWKIRGAGPRRLQRRGPVSSSCGGQLGCSSWRAQAAGLGLAALRHVRLLGPSAGRHGARVDAGLDDVVPGELGVLAGERADLLDCTDGQDEQATQLPAAVELRGVDGPPVARSGAEAVQEDSVDDHAPQFGSRRWTQVQGELLTHSGHSPVSTAAGAVHAMWSSIDAASVSFAAACSASTSPARARSCRCVSRLDRLLRCRSVNRWADFSASKTARRWRTASTRAGTSVPVSWSASACQASSRPVAYSYSPAARASMSSRLRGRLVVWSVMVTPGWRAAAC